ncbi:MAG TPA: hypothetical protein VEQ40_03455, partial [Pyrinomonadaceae bacterium]|nr:hypothetical protein [Pyrinomonadaceae bacterium]
LTSDSHLSREWFVIASSPVLKVALVAADKEGVSSRTSPEARRFGALKTSNPAMVSRLADIAEELVDLSLAA